MLLIFIGADHRGFKLKEALKAYVASLGYTVTDVGAKTYEEDDDYPAYAAAVAEQVSRDRGHARGILVCGSGVGVEVVANKFPGVRAALVHSPNHAIASRNDDDANVLALGADFTDEEQAKQILSVWLATPFSGDARHARRIEQIQAIENADTAGN